MDRQDWPLVKQLVQDCASKLQVPVFCKTRIFAKPADTSAFCTLLESAGCQLLALHGRTRQVIREGPANWDAIAQIKQQLRIPVLANGGMDTLGDAIQCLR